MRTTIALFALICLVAACAACAVKNDSPVARADELRRDGDCGQANRIYSQTLMRPANARDALLAHLGRGHCEMQQERYRDAYYDYYASKIIGCRMADQNRDMNVKLNNIPIKSFCSTYAKEMMRQAGQHLTADERSMIERQVEAELPKSYPNSPGI